MKRNKTYGILTVISMLGLAFLCILLIFLCMSMFKQDVEAINKADKGNNNHIGQYLDSYGDFDFVKKDDKISEIRNKETGVHYYMITSSGYKGGLAVVYNNDGSIRITKSLEEALANK